MTGLTIYERNMMALDECFPGFMDIIKNNIENIETENKLQVISEYNSDNTCIFKIEKENRMLYLNQKRNPCKMAEDWVRSLGKLHKNTPIIMCGLGNGVFLKKIIKDTLPTVNIILYEPSIEIFIKAMEEIELEEVFKDRPIGLIIEGVNQNEKEAIINSFIKDESISYLKEFIYPNYDELFPEEIRDFMKIVQKRVSRLVVNRNTEIAFSTMFPENFFNNLCYVCDGYKSRQLADVIPKDIPAIIVAAGPSLNKNVAELKKAKGKAFIIAVDSAVKIVVREGIIPDMIATLDGGKPLDVMKVEEIQNVPLLTSIMSSKEIMNFHKGKKIFYNENILCVNQLFRNNDIDFEPVSRGGSVATMAFAFSYMIGIDRIILVGQDLALTNNRTHADGTFEEKMEEIDTRNYPVVVGNYVDKIPTRGDFKNYLEWYETYIIGCKKIRPLLHVINATEGGAKIEGTEVMVLKEAIQQECKKDVDIAACIDKMELVFQDDARKKAIDILHKTPERLQNIIDLSKKGKKQYKKLGNICKYRDVDIKSFQRLYKSVEKITKEIESYPENQLISTTLALADFIVRSERDLKENTISEEGKEISRKGVIIMDLILECAEIFQQLAIETVAKVD